MKRAVAGVVAVVLAGCGYVGDPLPPALYIPLPVVDVRAEERGDQIVVEFTPPQLTTENLPFKEPPNVEVFVGPIPEPFTVDSWVAGAKLAAGKFPAKAWVGKRIAIAVRSQGPRGRFSGWSNFATIEVVPPLPLPTAWTVAGAPNGVKVTGPAGTMKLRVYRQAEGEEQPRLVATANGRDWTDATAEFGKKYSYLIQTAATAGDGEAESEVSAAKSITYEDKFPPAPVAGFAAIPGVNSVELAWDRATEADLKGYLVYRALEGGAFERLGELQTSPSCRDTTAVAGKKYRYRVTAVDVAGNESAPSEAVEIIAP